MTRDLFVPGSKTESQRSWKNDIVVVLRGRLFLGGLISRLWLGRLGGLEKLTSWLLIFRGSKMVTLQLGSIGKAG